MVVTEEGGYDGDGHIDGSETRLAELGEGGCSLGNCVGVGAPRGDVVYGTCSRRRRHRTVLFLFC